MSSDGQFNPCLDIGRVGVPCVISRADVSCSKRMYINGDDDNEFVQYQAGERNSIALPRMLSYVTY